MKRIDIKGYIIPQEDKWIYDWFEYPYTCANEVNKQLQEANGDDVEVYINSYGGAVHVGSEIYTSLEDYKGNVTIKIVGLAASAASVIGMGRKCLISPTGQIMIHNASTCSSGDYRDMDRTSEMLQKTNKSILNAYKRKTNLSEDKLKEIMDNETWLTAEEAKELGFVDGIMFEEDNENVQNAILAPMLYNSLPAPSMKAIEEMRSCGSVENFKQSLAGRNIPPVENKKIHKEEDIVTLNDLKEKYPDIYNEAVNQGISQERERIQGIENIAMPGFDEIINKAKFEEPKNAGEVSVAMIQAQKKQGSEFLVNMQTEKDELEEIEASDGAEDNGSKEGEIQNIVSNAVKYLKNRKGGKQ